MRFLPLLILFVGLASLLCICNSFSAPINFHEQKSKITTRNYVKTYSHRMGHRTTMKMGLEVKIRTVARKNGCEKWLEDSYNMYNMRLRSSNINVQTIWHKSNDDLIKNVEGDTKKGHSIVLLDPIGKTYTSEKFSDVMYHLLEQGGSRLSFVIGGAEGLPPQLKYAKNSSKSTHNLLSLSALTFTHQFTRTILMEQIYRASEIRKGSGYHK